MALRFDRLVRGIRGSVRQRVLLGRLSSGDGPVEMIALGELQSFLGVNIQTLLDTISSTRGAILYRGAAGWVILTPGTSGKFLQTLGAGADPTWASVPAGYTNEEAQDAVGGILVNSSNITFTYSDATPSITGEIHIASEAKGDVLYFDGADWVRLGAGTSGQALITAGPGVNPAWGDVALSASVPGLDKIMDRWPLDLLHDGINNGGGGSAVEKYFTETDAATSTVADAFAFKGILIIPKVDVLIYELWAKITSTVLGATYQGFIAALDGSNIITAITFTGTWVGTANSEYVMMRLEFASPVTLTAGTRYAICTGRNDGGDTYGYPTDLSGAQGALALPSRFVGYARVAKQVPAISDTITTATTAAYFTRALYSLP